MGGKENRSAQGGEAPFAYPSAVRPESEYVVCGFGMLRLIQAHDLILLVYPEPYGFVQYEGEDTGDNEGIGAPPSLRRYLAKRIWAPFPAMSPDAAHCGECAGGDSARSATPTRGCRMHPGNRHI